MEFDGTEYNPLDFSDSTDCPAVKSITAKIDEMPSMDELKAMIIKDAKAGVDFGCQCYYCEATPIDLVKRGDAIPMMYGDGEKIKIYCFRCSDEASYGLKSEHIKNPVKQEECFKAFKS